MRALILVAALAVSGLGAARPARAQRVGEPRFPAAYFSVVGGFSAHGPGHALPPVSTGPAIRRGNYGLEGAIAGGVLLGALGAWIGWEACRSQPVPTLVARPSCRSNAIAIGIPGAVVGAGVGYLVGRIIPRRPAP